VRLAKSFNSARLEAAGLRALQLDAFSYGSVKSIDGQPVQRRSDSCGARRWWCYSTGLLRRASPSRPAALLGTFGHQVKLIAPQLVRPYVKRGKNDGADAEALCEGMRRPTMRFVPVKTASRRH
jgi:hypothetical protein